MNISLNMGCGGLRFISTPETAWINIDARRDVGADKVADFKNLDYSNGSIARIVCIHALEHLPRQDAEMALKEWYRILRVGGELVIEVPNFDLTVKEYLEGDDAKKDVRITNIYGLQRFSGDQHCWGYNFKRLKKLLESIGFRNVIEIFDYSYHVQEEPCLRVRCEK
ncbi:MAG: methyltransferase domain-containing protein [Nitrospirae bacterium]|nr:methyltransferase domain-containing protein [Nitrospirota bacterium]